MLGRHQRLVDAFRADLEPRAHRPNSILSYEVLLIKSAGAFAWIRETRAPVPRPLTV